MKRLLSIPVLLLVLLLAVPALAQEEPAPAPAGDQVEEAVEGPAPAIVVQTDSADEGVAAWTFRFLVPTLLLLGFVTVGGVILYYLFRVKGRYRVVG